MKRAFSLIEIMIVVAILGILVAIVLPEFQSHTQQAKETATKDNLRSLRNAIERYAVQNNDVPPGYADNNPSSPPSFFVFLMQLAKDGEYIRTIPKNPFNKLITINVIDNDTQLPDEATGQFGWIYKPSTEIFKIDWPGVDSEGVRFYDY